MKLHWGCVFFLFLLSGCNIYNFIDKPSGDSQLLSAARACFDRGDYSCAGNYYSQLSAASSDQANSESAFEMLAQSGATVGVLMSAIKNLSSAGKMVTQIANTLSYSANETNRLNIFHAYQKSLLITDTKVRGLVKFITALNLTAELFGETAGTPGKFQQSDLVLNVTQCKANVLASCYPPSNSKLVDGTVNISLSTATDSQMSGSPTLYMINAAIFEIENGLTDLQSSGSVNSTLTGFNSTLISAGSSYIGIPAGSPSYRMTLLTLDIGVN